MIGSTGRTFAAFIACATFILPSRGHAQSIAIYGARASSGLFELDAPGGMGARVRVFPGPFMTLGAGLSQLTHTSTRSGTVCTSFLPPSNCAEEVITRDSRYRTLTLSAALRYRPLSLLELEGGAGITANQVFGTDRTESGRRTRLFVHRTLQVGWVLLAGGRIHPIADWPLTLEAGVATHRVSLTACATEPGLDDPYCGPIRLDEFRIGIAYDFGW